MILLHSQSFPHYGLDRFFGFAKSAGYDGVEILVTANYDTQNASYIKELEKRHDIRVKAFTLPSKVPIELLKGFQDVVKEFPQAKLNMFPAQSFSFTYKKWLENIAPKLCRKYDLKMNYRNMPIDFLLGVIPKNSENSLHSLREKGTICLDLSAVWSSKQDIMRTIHFLGDKLQSVYVSNVYQNRPYSRLETGILPIESFLTKLKQEKYKGQIVLNVSARDLQQGNDEKMVEVLKESRIFIEKYLIHGGESSLDDL